MDKKIDHKIYLTTGELANMLEVTKQTVIYYDKIGLISPIKRGDTKYRYYTLEQADELDSILTFRNLGVPIQTLKEYLGIRNTERCIELLRKQKEKLDDEIQKLDKIRKKIDSRQRILEQIAEVTDFEKVSFTSKEEEWYMIEPCLKKDEKTYMQCFISLCNRSKEFQIDFENPVCSIITRDDLLLGDFKKLDCFGIKIPVELNLDKKHRMRKPQGIYASTYHKGSYDSLPLSYERLMKVIEKEGYVVCGNAFEMDLLSTLTSADSEEYLKLISIQVSKED